MTNLTATDATVIRRTDGEACLLDTLDTIHKLFEDRDKLLSDLAKCRDLICKKKDKAALKLLKRIVNNIWEDDF